MGRKTLTQLIFCRQDNKSIHYDKSTTNAHQIKVMEFELYGDNSAKYTKYYRDGF